MSSIPSPKVSAVIKPGEKFLGIDAVREKTTFCRTHIYELEKSGNFPSRIHIFGRRVAWLESEVEAWMAGVVARRDQLLPKETK